MNAEIPMTVQVLAQAGLEQVDVTQPKNLEIVIRDDSKVVWINIDGRCIFRACKIGSLLVNDFRKS